MAPKYNIAGSELYQMSSVINAVRLQLYASGVWLYAKGEWLYGSDCHYPLPFCNVFGKPWVSLNTQSNLPYMNRWKSANKPATIKQVYPHLFAWIKPANVIQIIGQLQNLHGVGRSLVSFWLSKKFSGNLLRTHNFPLNRKQTSDLPTSGMLSNWPMTCVMFEGLM